MMVTRLVMVRRMRMRMKMMLMVRVHEVALNVARLLIQESKRVWF